MVATALAAARRVVVKVGTSTLTHPNGRLHLGRMEALARQLADLMAAGKQVVLVTSGAIGAGIGRLGLERRPDEALDKQALAAVGQGVLMQTYEKLCAEYNVVVAQILLTRDDLEDATRRASARATMLRLLAWQVLPIVNENDTVANEEIKLGDNDTLSARVAVLIDAELLVILSDVDGFYAADPRLHPDKAMQPLQVVRAITPEVMAAAGGAGSSNGSGGMRTKLQAAEICLQAGIPMVLAAGARPGVLSEIASGHVHGTLFSPAAGLEEAMEA